MNQKEQHCQKVLEELFPGYEFVKIRHPKIKNPETNRSLELDLYCEELGLAIEYNGPQHYYWIDFYHKTKEDFEKQKIRDMIKESYCDILSIQLIDVPNLQKYDEIKEYIIKSLDAKNIEYNKEGPILEKNDLASRIKRKNCTRCGIEKSYDEFSRDRRVKSGSASSCKECELSRVKKFREKSKSRTKTKKAAKETVEITENFKEIWIKEYDELRIKLKDSIDCNPVEFYRATSKINDLIMKIWMVDYQELCEKIKNPRGINVNEFNETIDKIRNMRAKIRNE
jgi:hypothetical protein